MSDHVQLPAAALDDGLDPPARRRPHPQPHPSLPDSRSSQVLCEFSESALPSLEVAFMRPQFGRKLAKPDLTTNRRVPSTCGSSVNSTRVIWRSPGSACHRKAKRCVGSTVSITPRLLPRGPVEPSHERQPLRPDADRCWRARRTMHRVGPPASSSPDPRWRTGRMTSRSIESGTSKAHFSGPATKWLHSFGLLR